MELEPRLVGELHHLPVVVAVDQVGYGLVIIGDKPIRFLTASYYPVTKRGYPFHYVVSAGRGKFLRKAARPVGELTLPAVGKDE